MSVRHASAPTVASGTRYGLLRDVLAWHFEIGDGDALDEAKLEAGILPLFETDQGATKAAAHARLHGQ